MKSANYLVDMNNLSKILSFFRKLHVVKSPKKTKKKGKEDFFFSFLSASVDDP